MRPGIPTHQYQPEPDITDWRGGTEGCAHCPLPRRHPVHDVPAVTADAVAADAARLGERTVTEPERPNT